MDKTWFFILGSKDKFLTKAQDLKADVLIFDLEDSVVPDEKAEARIKIKSYLSDVKDKAKSYIRVNEINS